MRTRREMRASDADREAVVGRLRAAADEGRLCVEELDERLGRALDARTYGQLDAIVSDLPSGHAADKRSRRGADLGQRRSILARGAGRAGSLVRSPSRAVTAVVLATAAAAIPVTVIEVGASGPSGRVVRVHSQTSAHESRLVHDWRESIDPNAPHPPVYYVMRASRGQ